MNFKNKTIRGYLSKSHTEEEISKVKEYTLDILFGIKSGSDESFVRLLEIKDTRLFINGVANEVSSKFDNKIDANVIKSEINICIFKFIKNTYRIYNEPNELQILITSMYSWLPKEVAKRIYKKVNNKEDEYLTSNYNNGTSNIENVEIDLTLRQLLTEVEYNLYKDRYIYGKTFTEIAANLKISEGAVRRRNKLLLQKIKENVF